MMSILKNRRLLRLIALVLAVVTLLTACLVASVPVLSANTSAPYVVLDGERVSEVVLEEDAKLRFMTVSELDDAGYCWQIEDPNEPDRWISISGGLSKYIWVTHALVGSMLKADGTAALRCRVTEGENEQFTQPVRVLVSFNITAPRFAAQSASADTAVTVNEEHTTHSIVINYLFDNNAIAFEPYGASVAKGSDFKASVTSPTVVGYAPFRRVGDDYIDASVVELDFTNIQEDITVNVIYEPALVEFSVHHHLQNLTDDDYSVHYDLITTGKALTGSVVGDGLALTERELPGFKALAYEKLTVAATEVPS